MECLGGDVNRMRCGDGMCGGGWVGKGDIGWGDVKSGWVVIGIGRLCVVCATTEICCKCNNFIQNHAPG